MTYVNYEFVNSVIYPVQSIKRSFSDLASANNYLSSVLEQLNNKVQPQQGKTAQQLLAEEQQVLHKLPSHPLDCSEQLQLRVDKYATVSHKGNRYSVPDHLVGKFVEVHLYSDKLVIYQDNFKVAEHARNYGRRQWNMDIEHYLETFKRKPGALANSLALVSNTFLKELYYAYFEESPKCFIDLLVYCKKYSISEESLSCCIDKLHHSGVKEITVEKVLAVLGNTTEATSTVEETTITQRSRTQLEELTELLIEPKHACSNPFQTL